MNKKPADGTITLSISVTIIFVLVKLKKVFMYFSSSEIS
jgi:hypothetical protein